MAYTLPQFNLLMDVWVPGTTPAGGPPAFQIQGQKYLHSRTDIDVDLLSVNINVPNISIRTDVQILLNIGPAFAKSIIGYKDSTGFDGYYYVIFWEWMHHGFSNEYLELFCWQCDDNGVFPDTRRG